jgi:hypothetical protein
MTKPAIDFRDVTERYDIVVGDNQYRVKRTRRAAYPSWEWSEWDYTVHGGSFLRSRWCDPDKPTFKRVVKALERELQTACIAQGIWQKEPAS